MKLNNTRRRAGADNITLTMYVPLFEPVICTFGRVIGFFIVPLWRHGGG